MKRHADNDLHGSEDNPPHEGLARYPGLPDDLSRINLNAVSFMANVPARLLPLMAGVIGQRADETKIRAAQTEKETEDARKFSAELSRERQREIDRHVLSFSIDGENIEISQGDLRKIMKSRMEALEKERRELLRTGRDPERVNRIEDLLGRYKPTVARCETAVADTGTMREMRRLMTDDPQFMAEMKQWQTSHVQSAERRTSFSNAFFNADAGTSSPLKAAFTRGASPASEASAPAPTPEFERRQANVKNNLEALGL